MSFVLINRSLSRVIRWGRKPRKQLTVGAKQVMLTATGASLLATSKLPVRSTSHLQGDETIFTHSPLFSGGALGGLVKIIYSALAWATYEECRVLTIGLRDSPQVLAHIRNARTDLEWEAGCEQANVVS